MGEQWEGVRQGAPTRTSQFTTIEILPQTELSPYLPDLIIISFSQESLQWSTVPVPCRWEFLEKNVQKKKKWNSHAKRLLSLLKLLPPLPHSLPVPPGSVCLLPSRVWTQQGSPHICPWTLTSSPHSFCL